MSKWTWLQFNKVQQGVHCLLLRDTVQADRGLLIVCGSSVSIFRVKVNVTSGGNRQHAGCQACKTRLDVFASCEMTNRERQLDCMRSRDDVSNPHLAPGPRICVHLVLLVMVVAGEPSLWNATVGRVVFAFDSRDFGVSRMIYAGWRMPNQPPVVVKMFQECAEICS
jgi:hypothetical protein